MYPCTKFQLIWRISDFGIKFAPKIMNDKNFEKISTKFEIRISNVSLYQILVNLKNFGFGDQICPKNTFRTNATS